MSAGIILMNKMAAVIAADSAVTVGDRSAIYNSSQKVFRLAPGVPVGIVTYSSVEFMDVPVEIIIRLFAEHVERYNLRFDYISDYASAFRRFAIDQASLFKFADYEEQYVEMMAYNFTKEYFGILRERGYEYGDEKVDANNAEVFSEAAMLLKQEYDTYRKLVKQQFSNHIKGRYFDTLLGYVHYAYAGESDQKAPDFVYELNKILIEIFAASFDRYITHGRSTGFAFAGFGEKELYPSHEHFSMMAFIDGRIRFHIDNEMTITSKTPRSVLPLAQSSVFDAFINGIDGQIEYELLNMLDNYYYEKFSDLGRRGFSDEQIKILNRLISENGEHVGNQIFEITRSKWGPFYNAVEVIPENELADLAENLINITSIRSKYSVDSDLNSTVGGPADVAIINKVDGFQWYTTKHNKQ